MKRLCLILLAVTGCKGSGSTGRFVGQTDYISAALPGTSNRGGVESGVAMPQAAGATNAPASTGASSAPRTVQETDIYRVDGNRLYVLNTYRGLLVFDITNPDQPVLLGRSPIYGDPEEMLVQNGIASIVVSDWFGALDDGTPYNGSLVRSVDMTDPTQPKTLAEAQVPGYVSDVRAVGNVLYAVSVDYGWEYGFGSAPAMSAVSFPAVYVTSVNIAGGAATQVAQKYFAGWSGAFHVTANSVLLAQDTTTNNNQTQLTYLDISDPNGAIAQRGQITISGSLDTWGADAGRWNIDLDAANVARAVTQADNLTLTSVDFSNPDTPTQLSQIAIPSTGNYSIAARFDSERLYIAPDATYGGATSTVVIYDVSSAADPVLKGSVMVDGDVWLFMPNGNELFALTGSSGTETGNAIAVDAIDVTDPAHPTSLGDASFGSGWAWTPAASTFKAFVMDATDSLIAIPFSGWSGTAYNNGVELISYAGNTVVAEGSAQIHGWVERGIFANGRLFALSDLALAVVDYSMPTQPRVVTELTLARNITALQPLGANIAELDEDWFGYDDHAELRILSATSADDPTSPAPSLTLDGTNARLFANGTLAYVVTDVAAGQLPCPTANGVNPGGVDVPARDTSLCDATTQRIQVIDLSSGTPTARGQVDLPASASYYYYGWGWGWGDWFSGSDVVQVGNDALAFRRWDWSGTTNTPLYVVDAHDPDHPSVASISLLNATNQWWGNMVVVGNNLYVTHDEWYSLPTAQYGYVRYYADKIDLSDRSSPHVGAKINIPGILVGGSSTDPSILYTLDYLWDGQSSHSWLNAVKLSGAAAIYQGGVDLVGDSGRVIVSGTDIYTSVYNWTSNSSTVSLHDVSFANPQHPKDSATVSSAGWGWLMDVQGDRAIVQSGWSGSGLDLYRLHPGSAPTYDQFVRTSGYWETALARQGQTLFFASGDYGVQTVTLPAR